MRRELKVTSPESRHRILFSWRLAQKLDDSKIFQKNFAHQTFKIQALEPATLVILVTAPFSSEILVASIFTSIIMVR